MFDLQFARSALEDLKRLSAHDRVRVVFAIEHRLAEHPDAASRNRKKLTGLIPPWDHVPPVWELRVGDHRVFYDVDARARWVIVRAVRRKGRSTTKEIL
jgi:mRNA-degrading endonuclease RelE of RelBE toxin-antitoxin system